MLAAANMRSRRLSFCWLAAGSLLLCGAVNAQTPVSAESRRTGLALLAQARAVTGQFPIAAQPYLLDQIAVVQFLAGEPKASNASVKTAIAAWHAGTAAARTQPDWAIPAYCASGALRAANDAMNYVRFHVQVNDAAGARAWIEAIRAVAGEMHDSRESSETFATLDRLQALEEETSKVVSTLPSANSAVPQNLTTEQSAALASARQGDIVPAIADLRAQEATPTPGPILSAALAFREAYSAGRLGGRLAAVTQLVTQLNDPRDRVEAMLGAGEGLLGVSLPPVREIVAMSCA